MIILNVKKDSIAQVCGFIQGDNLISINKNKINDILDFRFFSADDLLEVELVRNEKKIELFIEMDYSEDLGLEFEPLKLRKCGNNCVFCFIDQNPKGMRKDIYFKDEDYRLSFLYGNYITMTNLSQKEIDRIIKLRLSPLYISVHAINIDV